MPSPSPHRRDFVRSLALGAAAGAIASPAALRADDEKAKDKEKKDDRKDEAPKPKTEADARMELVLARYGNQLDEAARKSVRAEIDGHVRRAEALRKIPLDNGDGPFPVFHPYRAPLVEEKSS
jgi:hypothetical protein